MAARAANCLARPGGNCSGSGESDRRREFERSNRVNPCLFAVHLGQRFSVRIRRFCTAMDRTRSTRFIVPRSTTSSARLTISVLITNSALGAGSLPALIIPTLSVFPPATARELPSRRSSSFFGWRLLKTYDPLHGYSDIRAVEQRNTLGEPQKPPDSLQMRRRHTTVRIFPLI